MAVDPMIARGSPGIDVTNTLAQIAQMRQRDQMLQQQAQQNALVQQRYQAGVEQEDEEDRLWESAYQSKDWAAMARIDPQTTKILWDREQSQRPPGPITEQTLGSGRVLALQDGKPVGSPWMKPEPGKGRISMPDGTVIELGSNGVPNYAPTELGKATRTTLEDAFVKGQQNAMALQQQMAKWRPEFSTYKGTLTAAAGTVAEKAGARLTGDQQQYLSDFNSWRSDTTALLSAYLNQLSGAAISPAEEARLRSSFPNENDGPSQYQSKAKATMRRFALAQARAAYLLSNPSLTMDSVSLDQMQNIMVTEANSLASAYEQGGQSPDQARSMALQATRAKYGIGNGN